MARWELLLIKPLVLLMLLSGCATDKLLHAGAGAAVGATTGSCKASIAAGIAKEAYDATGRGTVDPLDAIATGLSGCLVNYLLDYL